MAAQQKHEQPYTQEPHIQQLDMPHEPDGQQVKQQQQQVQQKSDIHQQQQQQAIKLEPNALASLAAPQLVLQPGLEPLPPLPILQLQVTNNVEPFNSAQGGGFMFKMLVPAQVAGCVIGKVIVWQRACSLCTLCVVSQAYNRSRYGVLRKSQH